MLKNVTRDKYDKTYRGEKCYRPNKYHKHDKIHKCDKYEVLKAWSCKINIVLTGPLDKGD